MIWRVVPVSYWLVVSFIRVCLVLYVKGPTVEGIENVPRKGGAIIVSNHMNNADPCVLPGIMPRRIVFMAKKEWFNHPIGALIFRLIGAFPVDRQAADLGALREATRVVNDGLPLLMFPEGTRSKDSQLHQGFAGTALVAYRTGAPIVPVAIIGTETIPWPWVFVRPFMGPRVVVRIGKPFYPPKADRITSQAAKDATEDIMRHVAELLPEQYRGFYRDAVAAHAAEQAGLKDAERV
jgi:1-acyl-sn-glycerol-3-phosphate acyltransferase